MSKLLQLALPVLLHYKKEIQAFLEAKQRLESLGEKYNFPLEVGAFLLFLPKSSRTPESFEKQLENQKKYKLPIKIAETGVQGNNCLAYVPGDSTYNPNNPSDLEKVIEQTARLRDLDSNALDSLVIAPHIGVMVTDIPKGDFSRPCFYSPKDFVKLRGKIINNSKKRFAQLQTLAKSKGLTLALENSYLAHVEDSTYWQHQEQTLDEDRFKMSYSVLNYFSLLNEISKGNLVFDMAHFFAMKNLPAQFEANKDIVSPEILFSTMNISSWKEYREKVGNQEDYLSKVHGIHISQVEGIGVRLPAETEAAQRWGGGGALKPLISTQEFYNILRQAQEKNLPVNIEQDYSFKPLTYKEADNLLESVFEKYN